MSSGWDADYKSRGARWGGDAGELPFLPAGARVLECGCGNGKTLSAMLSRGWNAVGADISLEAVKLSNNSVVADVKGLPFLDDSFDAVFCWHLFGHLLSEERRLAATEIFRVVKPLGCIFFKGFSRNDLRYGKGEEIEEHTFLKGDGIFTHYFDECSLREVFGDGEIYVVSWNMRVRGENYLREELCGIFRKNHDGSDLRRLD